MGLAGSHTLAGEDALRSLSENATCGIVWAVVTVLVSILMSYSREWGKLSWWSFTSVTCILAASMITIVATGVQPDSVLVKNGAPIEWHAFPKNPSFAKIIGGLCSIVFAYGGNMVSRRGGTEQWRSLLGRPGPAYIPRPSSPSAPR
jgi:hypothetical protein